MRGLEIQTENKIRFLNTVGVGPQRSKVIPDLKGEEPLRKNRSFIG